MSSCICILLAIVASTAANAIPVQFEEYPTSEQQTNADPLVSAATNFSSLLLSDLSNDNLRRPFASRVNSNVIFSPLGVVNNLAFMRVCSAGQTRQEFDRLQIFQLPGDVTATFNALHNSLTTTTSVSQKKHHIPIPELINTNMMFLEFRLPFTAEFLTEALQFQNLCFFFEDFRGVPQEARKNINQKVSESTKGLIPNLLSSTDVSSDTQLVITSAVFLQGPWQTRFSDAPEFLNYFELPDRSRVRTSMMLHTSENFAAHILCKTRGNITKCRNASIPDILEIPFRGGRQRMVILMPNDNVASLDEIRQRLPSEINEWRENTERNNISVLMPKFQLNYEMDLKDVLAARGLENVFDSSTSDFSILTSAPLTFTKFIHKTSVIVDNSGLTFAAASASVSIIRTVYLPIAEDFFQVNKPFIFFIEDVSTKMMLFLGQVTDPR